MKSKKILKVVLIIVLILVIIAIIYILRNYIIISKLASMQEELAQKTNYSYVIEWYSENAKENKSVLKYYYKDGKSIEMNENTIISWINKNSGEQIVINSAQLTANVYDKIRSKEVSLPTMFAESSIKDKLDASLRYYISYAEINSQKCYVLEPLTGITSVLYYINAENGTLVRVSSGHITGQEDDVKITDYIEYSFDQLKEEDVSMPDLTGYEVTYYND